MGAAGQRESPRSSPAGAGFDFTLHMRRLCEDLASRLRPLRHIDMGRVGISFSQARRATAHGMYASLTPMRFSGGESSAMRQGRRWTVQRLLGPDGREILYILNFYLPRFLNLGFHEKLCTVIHELWHVGPRFDGDLRRFGGRCFAHGSSQRRFEAQVTALAGRWLALNPPQSVYAFLRHDFRGLVALHGHVHGRRVPAPKLIALD